MPVLNVYCRRRRRDPDCLLARQGGHFGTADYTELSVPGGHIGTFVGGKAQNDPGAVDRRSG